MQLVFIEMDERVVHRHFKELAKVRNVLVRRIEALDKSTQKISLAGIENDQVAVSPLKTAESQTFREVYPQCHFGCWVKQDEGDGDG